MSDELLRLRRDCGSTSDDYHRAVARWVTFKGRDKGHCDECLALATIYSKALVKLLVCLSTSEPTTSVTEEIARTLHYQQFLALDMSRGYQF